MSDWVLRRVERQLYRVENVSGRPMRDVSFGLRGAVVGGILGDRGWSHQVSVVGPGEGVEEVFGFGDGDAPLMVVSWIKRDGTTGECVLPFR